METKPLEMAPPSSFESNIASPDAPIAVDFESTRPTLLIAFGGLAGKLGMPAFEFFNLTSRLREINKIFLRDTQRLWYQVGLPGVGGDPHAIASYLQQYTRHPSTRRVIAIGNSGGGYAALLFGHMLAADDVHAFSPKTFLNPIWRIAALDVPSWRNFLQMTRLWSFARRYPEFLDLRERLSAAPAQNTQFHIYYSSKHRPDRLQAVRMNQVPGVRLHPFVTRGHDLIRQLKQSGELSRILERAING